MSDDLEIVLVLDRTNYGMVYRLTYIIFVIIMLTILLVVSFKYEHYYITTGKVVSGKLELLVMVNDIDYIEAHHDLELSGKKYNYRLNAIEDELYLLDGVNYQKIYLEVYKLSKLDNYVGKIKIPKENKRIITYLIDYFR